MVKSTCIEYTINNRGVYKAMLPSFKAIPPPKAKPKIDKKVIEAQEDNKRWVA